MLIKTTKQEIIKAIVTGICETTDNSICGKCSKCGECCSNLLLVTQREVDEIQRYVIEHNIRPQEHMLVMQNRLACPYYNGKKCLIYEIRPMICKEYYCYKKPDAEAGKKLIEEKRVTVDMWVIAREIDKYFRR